VGGLIGGALAAYLLHEGERRRAQALAMAACAAIAVAAVGGSIATSKASEEEPGAIGPISQIAPEP